jgi:hypothetical protein
VPEASPAATISLATATTTPRSTIPSLHTVPASPSSFCAFVAEAEYTGVFAAARIATNERQILADMGRPQPPTPIFCDNEVAIGLANDSINIKMSKSLDMRFHWLRDRVHQHQFRVLFVPGLRNIADFFKKALPVARHRTLAPFSAIDPDDDISNLYSTLNI